VYSLYGATERPTAAMLQGVDVLLFDIQDIGARPYTYVWTMAFAMEEAARHGIPFVVLDRPNPVTGRVEGPLMQWEMRRRGPLITGAYPVPLRHGLTAGELARYVNEVRGYGADLTVLPLTGWRRADWYDATGLPWVPPSPNIPTVATATVYPGTCLLEGTTLSEGRGTTLPFELLGAPWLDADRLAAALNALALPGAHWRPAAFTPWHGRVHVGVPCGGVQLHVTDRDAFRPVRTGIACVAAARAQDPARFAWRTEPYEFVSDRPAIDLLFGSDRERLALEAGAAA
jgi:uncharacterized protein YbbC (DUF1343 family)